MVKLKAKPKVIKVETEQVEVKKTPPKKTTAPKEVKGIDKEEQTRMVMQLTKQIDLKKGESIRVSAELADLIKERFYAENYPFVDGDIVVASVSNNEVVGMLEYDHVASITPSFYIRPYKKDSTELSGSHRRIYHTDKILRYSN